MTLTLLAAAAGIAAILAWPPLATPRAQVQKIDAEKSLAEQAGFSAAEIEQARSQARSSSSSLSLRRR